MQRGRLAAAAVAVAWLALFSIGCVPTKAVNGVGTTSDPLYPRWGDAETALNVVLKACVWKRPSSFFGVPTLPTVDDGPNAPEDPAACTKAWVASEHLPGDAGGACYELVGGASAEWYGGNGTTRSTAAKTLAEFAGADRVIAVNYTGDDMIGRAAVLVVRKGELREGYVAPIDARVRLLLRAFDDRCPATLREPSAPANCLRALVQLRADVPAFLNTLSSQTLEAPFAPTRGLVLRSPGCYQLATQAEFAANARVQVAVEATLQRGVGAAQAAKDAAKLHACGEPTHSSDCEAAQSYLALLGQYEPNSSDVGIVTALLEGAKPKLEALSDHEAWSKTSVAECAAPISESGCEAVERYISQRPSGLHAPEAHAALAAGTPTLTRMVARREVAERAEAARVSAEEAREEARRQREEALEKTRRRREEALERLHPKPVETTSRRACRSQDSWRHTGNTADIDVIYTDSGGIALWCQDGSGKSCVEGAMTQRGQFSMMDVRVMAADCCCKVMD